MNAEARSCARLLSYLLPTSADSCERLFYYFIRYLVGVDFRGSTRSLLYVWNMAISVQRSSFCRCFFLFLFYFPENLVLASFIGIAQAHKQRLNTNAASVRIAVFARPVSTTICTMRCARHVYGRSLTSERAHRKIKTEKSECIHSRFGLVLLSQ